MPEHTSDDDRFDWGAEEAATKHGYTVEQIEAAFEDPRRVIKNPATANHRGKKYDRDSRRVMLAQPQPNGPYLQIAFVIINGRIHPLHCQRMSEKERSEYSRGKRK